MTKTKESPEYQSYKIVELWKPEKKVFKAEDLVDSDDEIFPLFSYIYQKTKKDYREFPKRKNREDPFVHPLNLVFDLKKAKINDGATLCLALAHDLVEEKVDLYKEKNKIPEDRKGIRLLDHYEEKVFQELERELLNYCQDKPFCKESIKDIVDALRLLTRHKREFYYRSVSNIFLCPNNRIKKMAIQVKLADRIHNIQCLQSFNEQEKNYQCFKNLYILNNVKAFLKELYGPEADPDKEIHSTDKLFKKCAKATYGAFVRIIYACLGKRIGKVTPILQLALKKFAFEEGGLWEVTKLDKQETHPMRLFRGIVAKFSARLHQEWEKFEQLKKEEMSYCEKFFADFNFSKKQLQAIIDYKDAYALKEVIAHLLYNPEFIISGFTAKDIKTKERI